MKKEVIRKSVEIAATRQKVWDVLFNDELTRIWFAEFGDDIHAETDWKLGSKASFTDKEGSGIVGKIAINKPYEVISIEYDGLVTSGKEDYESDYAKQMKGFRETYLLIEKNGHTNLSIECDVDASIFESMSLSWDQALKKIKELSEK